MENEEKQQSNDIECTATNTTTTTTTPPPHGEHTEQSSQQRVELEINDDSKDNEQQPHQQEQQQKLDDMYEELEGNRIMVIVDSDDSTARAFDTAFKEFDKDKDEFYFLTVTSSLDYLNDEKNNAKLALFKYQNYLDIKHIDYIPISVESLNILGEIKKEIEENEIDIVYIGAQALSKDANPDNMIFSLFSYIKRTVFGTIVYGLEKASKNANNWKLKVIE